MTEKIIVTGHMLGKHHDDEHECSDIDRGETPVRCACGKLRQANRRCGEKRVLRDLVYRSLGR
jgi:hypothetical protein